MLRRSVIQHANRRAGAIPASAPTAHFKAAMSSMLHPSPRIATASADAKWVDIDTSFVDISDDFEEPRHHKVKELLTAPDEPHMQRFLDASEADLEDQPKIKITQERRLAVVHSLIEQCKEYVTMDRDGMLDGNLRKQELNSGPHYEDVDRRSKRRRMWYGIREAFETCRYVVWVTNEETGAPEQQPVPADLLYDCTAWYQSAEAMRVLKRLDYENTPDHWYEEIDMTREVECLMRAIRDDENGQLLRVPPMPERHVTLLNVKKNMASGSGGVAFEMDEIVEQEAAMKAKCTEVTSRIMRCYNLCKRWHVPFIIEPPQQNGDDEDPMQSAAMTTTADQSCSTLISALGSVSSSMSSWQALALLRTISDDTAAYSAIFGASIAVDETLGRIVSLFEVAANNLDTFLQDDANLLLQSIVEFREACPAGALTKEPTSDEKAVKQQQNLHERLRAVENKVTARCRILLYRHGVEVTAEDGLVPAAQFMKVLGQQHQGLDSGTAYLRDQDRSKMMLHNKMHRMYAEGQNRAIRHGGTSAKLAQTMADLRELHQSNKYRKQATSGDEKDSETKPPSGSFSGRDTAFLKDLINSVGTNMNSSFGAMDATSAIRTLGLPEGSLNVGARAPQLLSGLDTTIGKELSSIASLKDLLTVVKGFSNAYYVPKCLPAIELHALKLSLGDDITRRGVDKRRNTVNTVQEKCAQIMQMLAALGSIGSEASVTYDCAVTTLLEYHTELVEGAEDGQQVSGFRDEEERAQFVVDFVRAVGAVKLPAGQKSVLSALQFLEFEVPEMSTSSKPAAKKGKGKKTTANRAAWGSGLIERDAVGAAVLYSGAASKLDKTVGATPADIDGWERTANYAITEALKLTSTSADSSVGLLKDSDKVGLLSAVHNMLAADKLALSTTNRKSLLNDVLTTVNAGSLSFKHLVQLNCLGLQLSTPKMIHAAKFTEADEPTILACVDQWQKQLLAAFNKRRSWDRNAALDVVNVIDSLRGEEIALDEELQQVLVSRLE